MNIEIKDEMELKVVQKALQSYHKRLIKQQRNIEIMSRQKFNYGDLVFKKGQRYFDGVFGINESDIGVIVGSYECDNMKVSDWYPEGTFMYRVHYSDNNDYVGEQEVHLEKYEGECPEHLKNVTWNEISCINITLE